MKIQFNSDNRVEGHARLAEHVTARLDQRLQRFKARLSRVEAHVRDIDGTTNAADGIEMRLEARPLSGDPLFSKGRGRDVDAALVDALTKLVAVLDGHFGKQGRVR